MNIYPIEAQPVSKERQLEAVAVLLEVWAQHPYLRASQLISNAIQHYYKIHGKTFDNDIYYVENQLLIDALKEYPNGKRD